MILFLLSADIEKGELTTDEEVTRKEGIKKKMKLINI